MNNSQINRLELSGNVACFDLPWFTLQTSTGKFRVYLSASCKSDQAVIALWAALRIVAGLAEGFEGGIRSALWIE